MERPYTDLGWLREWTQIKAKVLEPGFELREIVPTATTMYDPQQGWLEDDGAMVITDIGGQGEPGWNPEKGHGAILKVHPDNRIEPIVPYGGTGRAMIMASTKSPPSFGEYAGRPFPLGQLRPGRAGAHNTHAVFWVPPGANWVEPYVVVPDSGAINGGKAGALLGPGFGPPGTPEDGFMFVTSMFNCTMYKVTSTRQIWPWIVGEPAHAGIQFMPRWLYRAPVGWGEHAGKLICEGVESHSFSTPASKPGEPRLAEKLVWFVVDDQGEGRRAKLTQIDAKGLPPYDFPDWPGTLSARRRGGIAPKAFGPFAGQRFVADVGTAHLQQTSMMPDGPLPYDASVYRIDETGARRPFITDLQTGDPQVRFQGDRMLITLLGKSYSTGDFHYPDGGLLEVVYVGT